MNKGLKKIRNSISKYRLTFENVFYIWLEYKKSEIKISTYSTYRYNVTHYLFPKLKELTLKKLEKYNFNELADELSKDLSPKKTRDVLCNLKSILSFIEEEFDCKTNFKKIKGPKLVAKPTIILNDREIKKLEKYCLKLNTLRSIGIIICLNTGLRIGEICALKWENIDLDRREIYIKKTLQRVYSDKKLKKTEIIVDTPKTQTSIRTIPISNKLYEVLIPLKNKYKNEDFLLTGNEKGIEPKAYRDIFKDYLKKTKIKSHKFHILRHTFATKCIENGMDIKSLSEILGHSSVEITLNKYVHSSYKVKKKYLEKL